jgi:hypothetical protein
LDQNVKREFRKSNLDPKLLDQPGSTSYLFEREFSCGPNKKDGLKFLLDEVGLNCFSYPKEDVCTLLLTTTKGFYLASVLQGSFR